jgi:hypothetical protein
MFRKNFKRATAAVALLLPGAAAGTNVHADHCGLIASRDGQYNASFTLVRDDNPNARLITVFLCDNMFNCDTVFSAPRTARVSMGWQDDGRLLILSSSGGAIAPGALGHSGTGRPATRIVIEPLRVRHDADSAHIQLSFEPRVCRLEPPFGAAPVIVEKSSSIK